ncbi:MAG: hypothetical protein ACYST3_05090 [Planctomycetota bacterium]|jgi:hypothetical protein
MRAESNLIPVESDVNQTVSKIIDMQAIVTKQQAEFSRNHSTHVGLLDTIGKSLLHLQGAVDRLSNTIHSLPFENQRVEDSTNLQQNTSTKVQEKNLKKLKNFARGFRRDNSG